MRKITKILSLILVIVMAVGCFAACTPKDTTTTTTTTGNNGGGPNPLEGTYDITVWISEVKGVKELTEQQINAFMEANPGIVINATVNGVPEGDAATQMLADIANGPDIFGFAQDQLARLVSNGALAALPEGGILDSIKANNDKGSVSAASVAGTVYAYPMTSDNGYFMYYDKSVISEDDVDDLTKLIAACEAAGKKFHYALEDGWYTASFFFATGCHSNWTMDTTGKFTSVDDNFNSPEGLIAMRGMHELASNANVFVADNQFVDAAVVVSGTWSAKDAADAFGENMGVTDLPSFTVDGKPYHLGSFSGNKLMGVKPQSDSKRAAVLSLLAQYLTGEECQMQRFEQFSWGPSNLAAQASEAVQSNAALVALAKQSKFAVPQGNIAGDWWASCAALGTNAKSATDVAGLQAALDSYKAAIDGILNKDPANDNVWSVIGKFMDTNWDIDFTMTEVEPGKYVTDEVIELKSGDEFKLRRGLSWDGTNIGVDGKHNGGNFVVDSEMAGKYKIQLEWTEGATTGVVTLIPVEE